jgi:hypothetical protein
VFLRFQTQVTTKIFQMHQLLAAISEADIQTSRSNYKNSESFDDFSKLFIQVEAQQIEFTTWGFYKINYNLLAGVAIEIVFLMT